MPAHPWPATAGARLAANPPACAPLAGKRWRIACTPSCPPPHPTHPPCAPPALPHLLRSAPVALVGAGGDGGVADLHGAALPHLPGAAECGHRVLQPPRAGKACRDGKQAWRSRSHGSASCPPNSQAQIPTAQGKAGGQAGQPASRRAGTCDGCRGGAVVKRQAGRLPGCQHPPHGVQVAAQVGLLHHCRPGRHVGGQQRQVGQGSVGAAAVEAGLQGGQRGGLSWG